MKEVEKIFLNAFNILGGINQSGLRKIGSYFKTFEAAWNSSFSEFTDIIKIADNKLEKLKKDKKIIYPEKEWEKLIKDGQKFILENEAEYPKILKEISDPPFGLYVKGNIPEDSFNIAIVGTRLPTTYGRESTRYIANNLAAQGLPIVSGLAFGIDEIAHKAALEAGGKTLAVIGSGLDKKSIYPQSNASLAEKLSETGAVISEYPFGTKPQKYHFPLRNRIISGLSKAVIVIEAKEKSGALVTAMQALEQNRDVFALPGSIFSKTSVGTNNLIKAGAHILCDWSDILNELNLKINELPKKEKYTEEISKEKNEILIFKNITENPININEIVRKSGLSAQETMVALTSLEIKGFIKNTSNGYHRSFTK